MNQFMQQEADHYFTKDQQRFALNVFMLVKMIQDQYVGYKWTF